MNSNYGNTSRNLTGEDDPSVPTPITRNIPSRPSTTEQYEDQPTLTVAAVKGANAGWPQPRSTERAYVKTLTARQPPTSTRNRNTASKSDSAVRASDETGLMRRALNDLRAAAADRKKRRLEEVDAAAPLSDAEDDRQSNQEIVELRRKIEETSSPPVGRQRPPVEGIQSSELKRQTNGETRVDPDVDLMRGRIHELELLVEDHQKSHKTAPRLAARSRE
ncbi:MAG TPA: hypothetical protein VFC47_02375 [Caulobacteraceae bacterium]|nr:hypothetical protein [Caulobacteraceae bacterium]